MRIWLRLLFIGLVVAVATSAKPTMAQGETPATPTTTEATPPAPEATAKPEEKKPPTTEERLAAIEATQAKYAMNLDTVWTMVAGMLVFFMNLGFGCVESGMCRAKNCVNILAKNFVVFAASTLAFWALGWGLMFGNGSPYYGSEGLLFGSASETSGAYSAIAWANVPFWVKFFFQLVFAGTAATIVSGAVAERIKYHAFIAYTFFLGILLYPITGHWIWGGGWLGTAGFFDFAGSTVVHSVGGWAALTGAIILGPRLGKYGTDGKPKAIPGHSMMAATIGCLILWLGWFGFNPGSTMSASNPVAIGHIAVTTNTAGAIATLTATATAWIMLGKPDIGMTLNGCLAGLVAITAGCSVVSVPVSALIGGIAGVLVVVSVITFDRMGVDDPVGATSVHLANGVFGTLCVGLFADSVSMAATGTTACKVGLLMGGGTDQLIPQITGILAVGAYTLVMSATGWLILKYTIGIRVTAAEETEGLDLGEHGNEAYHGFVIQEG